MTRTLPGLWEGRGRVARTRACIFSSICVVVIVVAVVAAVVVVVVVADHSRVLPRVKRGVGGLAPLSDLLDWQEGDASCVCPAGRVSRLRSTVSMESGPRVRVVLSTASFDGCACRRHHGRVSASSLWRVLFFFYALLAFIPGPACLH